MKYIYHARVLCVGEGGGGRRRSSVSRSVQEVSTALCSIRFLVLNTCLTCTATGVLSHLYSHGCTISPVQPRVYYLTCTAAECTISPVQPWVYYLTCTAMGVLSQRTHSNIKRKSHGNELVWTGSCSDLMKAQINIMSSHNFIPISITKNSKIHLQIEINIRLPEINIPYSIIFNRMTVR